MDRADKPGVCAVLLATLSCCCRLSEEVLSAHPARVAVKPRAGNHLVYLLAYQRLTKPISQQVWVDTVT